MHSDQEPRVNGMERAWRRRNGGLNGSDLNDSDVIWRGCDQSSGVTRAPSRLRVAPGFELKRTMMFHEALHEKSEPVLRSD